MEILVRLLFAALLLPAAVIAAEKPRGLEVLITADATATPEVLRPKPGKPIHYILAQTRQSMGEAIAGIKMPPADVLEKAVVAELAKQGFVRTEVGGPVPEIFIMAIVGDANFEEPPADDLEFYLPMVNRRKIISENGLDMNFEPDQVRYGELAEIEARRIRYRMSPRFKDQQQINNLVGADKVVRAADSGGLSRHEAERIAWAAYENRYFVSLNAFDAQRWTKKEKVLLWRTSMLIDWRKDLTASLPTMLAQAGPLFGTDAPVPTFVDERDRKKSDVQIGEAIIVREPKTPSETEKK